MEVESLESTIRLVAAFTPVNCVYRTETCPVSTGDLFAITERLERNARHQCAAHEKKL